MSKPTVRLTHVLVLDSKGAEHKIALEEQGATKNGNPKYALPKATVVDKQELWVNAGTKPAKASAPTAAPGSVSPDDLKKLLAGIGNGTFKVDTNGNVTEAAKAKS